MSNIDLLSILSESTGIDKSLCLKMVLSAPKRYKVYGIPKRNKENENLRIIAQPTAIVKSLQRCAIEIFNGKIPVHESATAYSKNSSIYKNVLPHVSNSYILKTDFDNFFNSIKPQDLDILKLESTVGLTDSDILILKHLFFWLPKDNLHFCLSVGAPSSPMLTNYLMYDFDKTINEKCQIMGATYTRYSDDITISTNEKFVLKEIYQYIESICEHISKPSVRLNLKKTVFTSKKYKRFVTGLIISNDGKITIGREKKRLIRSILYNIINDKKVSYDSMEQLNGLLSFVAYIEPHFLNKLCIIFEDNLGILRDKGVSLDRYFR